MCGTAGVVVGHLPAAYRVVRIAEHVVDVALKLHSPEQGCAELAIAGEDPVLLPHGVGAAHDGRFLTEGADVETDASLALQRDQPFVHDARERHVLVEVDDFVGAELGIVLRGERAVVLEHADDVTLVASRFRESLGCRCHVEFEDISRPRGVAPGARWSLVECPVTCNPEGRICMVAAR